MSALSSQKTSHALRNFTSIGVLWAVYGPNATAAGAIFAGFALSIGVTEPQVAFLVSLTALVGAWQLLSFYLTRRIKNKRLFAIGLGVLEITSASAVVLMALVAPQYRFFGMALLLVAAYLLGNTGNPTFNNWMSNVIPPEVRTRYLGSRMFAVTVASVLWLFVASRWLDLMNKSYLAFAVVFAVGWIAGLMGYGVLGRTDYPPLAQAEPEGFARSLLSPLRNRPFALLMLYQITRTTSYMIAGAFYGVYMIRYLALSYSQIGNSGDSIRDSLAPGPLPAQDNEHTLQAGRSADAWSLFLDLRADSCRQRQLFSQSAKRLRHPEAPGMGETAAPSGAPVLRRPPTVGFRPRLDTRAPPAPRETASPYRQRGPRQPTAPSSSRTETPNTYSSGDSIRDSLAPG